ncbi:hypothetical protein JB92DRAFT_3110486 [Gautieria morchelliformis]|nr:hypothetical protein JB92DRAFT_3110486 [Gautieria morchelliformis]
MAAALGLTAAIIAVLQLTGVTIGACYSYGNGIKNAMRDKERIIDQLFGLQKVLDCYDRSFPTSDPQFCNTFCPSDISATPSAPPIFPTFRPLYISLVLSTLLLGPTGPTSPFIKIIRPVLLESEVNKSLEKLRKLQDLLTTAMDVDQTYVTAAICLTLKIDSGVEALQAQGAKNSQLTQDMKGGVQGLQETTTAISGAMEQTKQHTSHIARLLTTNQSIGMPVTSDRRRLVHDKLHYADGGSQLAWERRSFVFFYFDFNNKDTLPNAVLRSLIKQLSLRANTFHALKSLFAQNEHGGAHRAPGQEELMNTLKSIIKGYQTVYLVFDALDECPE